MTWGMQTEDIVVNMPAKLEMACADASCVRNLLPVYTALSEASAALRR